MNFLAPRFTLIQLDLKKLNTHSILVRYDRLLQKKEGFRKIGTTQSFIGSPGRIIVRYRIQKSEKFSAGLNLEKDEGEHYSTNKAHRAQPGL